MMTLTTAVPNSSTIQWPGGSGEMIWQAGSTAGSGSPTLSLQRRESGATDDSKWTQIGNGTSIAQLTATGTIGFMAGKCDLRLVLASSTGATIYCDAIRAHAGRLIQD